MMLGFINFFCYTILVFTEFTLLITTQMLWVVFLAKINVIFSFFKIFFLCISIHYESLLKHREHSEKKSSV